MSFETFHFIRPIWLLGALALPVMLWVFARRGRSAGAWQRVCDPALLPHLLVAGGGRGHRWPLGLLAAGWLAACVALAGPTWEQLPQTAYTTPTETVAVMALTPSLLARDVAPSRLAQARFALRDLLEQAEGTVGLVVYAEEGYPITPLTDDPRVIAETLPVLEPGLMPGRGARLDRGLDEALALLAGAGSQAGRIVVLSDGAGEAPDEAVAAARRARRAGHVVSVLSLTGEAGDLDRVASAGGGAFVAVRHDDRDIEQVLAAGGATLPGQLGALRESEARADVWRDMGAWLVLVPLALAPLAFRRGWAGALGLLWVVGTGGGEARAGVADWWQRPDQQAAQDFEAGRHAEAAKRFVDPEWQGIARYRAGDFAGAIESLGDIEKPRAQYNLGNALAHAGQLEQAIAAYDAVLDALPEHADALHNRELVQQLLDQQQQDEQPQRQQEQEQEQQQQQERQQQEQPQEDQQSQQQPQQGQQDQSGQQGNDSDSADSRAGNEGSESSESSASAERQGSQQRAEGEPGEQSAEAAEPAGGARPERADAGDAQPGEAREPRPETRRDHAAEPRDQPAAGQPADESESADDGRPVAGSALGEPMSERDQEIEHMLSRVPDDPGGLLREKLRRRYIEKQGLLAGPGGRR